MPTEPDPKRVTAFFDGQNLFHAVKGAFGYKHPNYDPMKLAKAVCDLESWQLYAVRFYTGVPDPTDNAHWHHFWKAKGAQMGRQGIHVYTRPLKYRNKTVTIPDGSEHTFLTGDEKGIDVRLALDVIRLGHRQDYDVALVFSQDQDLSEVADEVRVISREQNRWIKMACAFPKSPTLANRRGINKTDWMRFDRALYDQCIDRRDYRPKRRP